MRDVVLGLVGLGAMVGIIASGFYDVYRLGQKSVQSAALLEDLNKDGTLDFVTTLYNGKKVPLFGVMEGENIVFYSASEMLERDPESIINYDNIESLLNQ